MFEPAAAAWLNHLLRSADWAREALRPYAGRCARFENPPFGSTFTVLENGEVAPAPADAQPDVVVRITPGLALRLAAGDSRAWSEADVSGDTDFAAAIHQLARNLRWDVEEDLSRVVGDIAAHRMARAGRALRQWAADTLEHTGRTLAEYWMHEQPLIAGRVELEHFNDAVDRLRDDVARLEKRIEALARRAAR